MTVIQENAKSAPQKIIRMSEDDRKAIDRKVRNLLKEINCAALIACAPGNFTYCSGIVLPYPEQYATPKTAFILNADEDAGNVICAPDWEQLCADQGWKGESIVFTAYDGLFSPALIKMIARKIGNRKKVGLDIADIPVGFFNRLKNALPGVEWIDISNSVKALRMIKTDAEIKMIEEACRVQDRASIAAMNHSEGCVGDILSYYLWEFAERIRVHIGEFGGSGCGHLTAVQGDDMRLYAKNPQGSIVPGNPLRYESSAHHYGYWTQNARTIFIGRPSPEFEKAYEKNVALKKAAVEMLRPGVTSAQVFEAVRQNAIALNADFFAEAGAGHGVGISEREAPYLSPNDHTVLQKGMTIVLSIYTRGPARELICSKDTYEITDDGSRLLSWYKNYDELYSLHGTAARHG